MHRLMTDVKRFSQWQCLYVMVYLLIMMALIMLTSLSWIGWVVVLISTGLGVFFIVKTRHVPLHMTAPREDDIEQQWQLLYKNQYKNKHKNNHAQTQQMGDLWEAKLQHARTYRHFVQLTFWTTHPMPSLQTVIIWQDQIDIDAWRRLRVLAHWGL